MSIKKWTDFVVDVIIFKGRLQGNILKVLCAVAAFYVFHGDHFEEQSFTGCINPILGSLSCFVSN